MEKEQTLQKIAEEYEAAHAEHASPTLSEPEPEPETLPPPPEAPVKRTQPQLSQPKPELIPVFAPEEKKVSAVPDGHPWSNPMRTYA